jgi:glycosyltransferase involved in cell wall biosynthesis
MKTVIDISLLGSAYYSNRHRTGIARTVEDLLYALTDLRACELDYCAYNSLEQLIQSAAYLASSTRLGRPTLTTPRSGLLDVLVAAANKVYPDAAVVAKARLRRRVVSFFLKRFNTLYRSLDTGFVENADVLHSTFYALPEYRQQSKKLRRFITIYDMIPVLFPQYFESQITANFHNIIGSIRPDDWAIAISHSTKNDLCDYLKMDPSRVFVTHLAASETFYQCRDEKEKLRVREKYAIPEGPYLLSLSTLEPRKNIDHTLRCFARTVQEQGIQDLNLVLVGTKGWDFDKIFQEITRNPSIQKRVIVTGYVPDEDLAALYSGSMMFVYPSLYEGFGLPPLEAMQCGVPVITSNTSSLPEVVGEAGIMVDPRDEDTLCQSIWNLYSNSKLRTGMSLLSVARAAEFSWKKCAQDTVAAYKNATSC